MNRNYIDRCIYSTILLHHSKIAEKIRYLFDLTNLSYKIRYIDTDSSKKSIFGTQFHFQQENRKILHHSYKIG